MAPTKNDNPAENTTTEQDVAQFSEEEAKDLAVRATSNTARADIASLNAGGSAVYSTLTGTDFATRVQVATAITTSEPIAENLNKVIALRNIVAQAIEINDEATGEIIPVVRMVLLDDENKAYHAISNGLFKAVENILGVLGHPSSWPAPVPIKVVQEGTGTRKYYTIKFA